MAIYFIITSGERKTPEITPAPTPEITASSLPRSDMEVQSVMGMTRRPTGAGSSCQYSTWSACNVSINYELDHSWLTNGKEKAKGC